MRTGIPGRFVLPPSVQYPTVLTCYSCACDVPAHTYTYSFEPNPSWSSVFAYSAEISAYLERYIKTRHEIVGAQWDEAHARWDVRITDLATGRTFVDACHVLVNAGGILNSWKWPEINGLETFGGKLIHSADWDATVDLKGKRVGLIGNGLVPVP